MHFMDAGDQFLWGKNISDWKISLTENNQKWEELSLFAKEHKFKKKMVKIQMWEPDSKQNIEVTWWLSQVIHKQYYTGRLNIAK